MQSAQQYQASHSTLGSLALWKARVTFLCESTLVGILKPQEAARLKFEPKRLHISPSLW